MTYMLYHGSKTTGIKLLKPFPRKEANEESVVFATSDIRFALAMIYGTDKELEVGYFTDKKSGKEEMYIREVIPNAFKLLEAPGAIYELEDSGFALDPHLSHREYISKYAAPIISEIFHPNIFSELKKYEIDFIDCSDSTQ